MRAVSFQSRSGFLLSCDDSTNATALTTRTVEFQSRSGFLLSCDQSTQSHPIGPQGCFNPVLGFYCPATVSAASRHSLWVCFNPVLGFYCPATHLTNLRTRRIAKFQSRSGFLLSCDSASRFSARASASCFNPVLGFYCPATSYCYLVTDEATVFQSRSGFLLSCDGSRSDPATADFCFNPVLGFYCPATGQGFGGQDRGSRRFNPVLGFYCPATTTDEPTQTDNAVFQSRSGFLLSCDG